MEKAKRRKQLVIWLVLIAAVFAACLLTGTKSTGNTESIQEVMKDGVLHETSQMSLFGLAEVNPSMISAMVVAGILIILAALIRFLVIPKFKRVPGKLQLVLETWVGFFHNLAKSNSPEINGTLGAYIFAAGSYIFVGTCFELFGVQAVTTTGKIMSLPAPLADINAAIALGCLSYGFILFGGLSHNGWKGVLSVLKDFSLPISMSFRLFGALLSGLLVTELVYYYINLSFVLPVAVGVMFTLMHALIQTYVLVMLTAMFYGEAVEKREKKAKKSQKK